jgi:hypothetical protein
MISFRFILGFHGGDYTRKQSKQIVIDTIDEMNLTDERWQAIMQ